MQVYMAGAMILAAVVAGIQWLFFRSVPWIIGATILLTILAVVTGRQSLGKLERKIRENLILLGRAPQTILKEVE
jgi:membrane protein implicated in regulation of membrane protease activity